MTMLEPGLRSSYRARRSNIRAPWIPHLGTYVEGIRLAAKLIGYGFVVGLYPPPPRSARAEPEDEVEEEGGEHVQNFLRR